MPLTACRSRGITIYGSGLTLQIATQIALAHPKCKVAAIAGSAEKLDELKKMGVHHALNYKDADFAKQLRKVGLVDVYFDNGTSWCKTEQLVVKRKDLLL